MSIDELLAFAKALADVADEIALRYWRRDFTIQTKPDRTPVTEADLAIEKALRARIHETYPGHGILGEEFGTEVGADAYRWIIDPIDATAAFLRGVPNFATLIGLEHHDKIVAGVVSAPAMGLRWWGGPDIGAYENDTAIHVSKIATLDDAHITHGELGIFGKSNIADGWNALWPGTWRQSGLGDFYGHMVIASGAAELMPEPYVGPWDVAAVKAVVEGAGGRLTDLDGNDSIYTGHSLTSNGLLHDEALRILRGEAV